jgi:hypothetical protein
MRIELLTKWRIYEQPLNENALRDPMMLLDALLDAHFNGVSTEIVFGSIFRGRSYCMCNV